MTAFVPGQSPLRLEVRLSMQDIAALAPAVQATGELYAEDGLRALLMSYADMPPSGLMLSRETLLTLRAQYAKCIEQVFKEKLKEASETADREVMRFLIERGIEQ